MFWLNYESIWCDMVHQKGSLPAKTVVGWPLDLLEWCFTTQDLPFFTHVLPFYVYFPGGVYFGISLGQSRKKPCGIFRGLGF